MESPVDRDSSATEGFDSLCEEAEKLGRWMFDEAMPLWEDAGLHASGASWEALDFTGRPLVDDETRVRVQARQVFVFALAHELGWQPDRCRRRVEALSEVLVTGCRREDGLYGRRLSLHNGSLSDDTYSLYDTAFALLALAKARAVLDRSRVDAAIEAVFAALRDRASHPDGGYREFLPASSRRLQNPHMHLFESCLAVCDSGYRDGERNRAGRLLAFIDATFFDRQRGIVHERCPADAAVAPTFEPGHSLEWVWLLSWRARIAAAEPDPFAFSLYARALGTLDENGLVCMEANTDGNRTDPSCRLWAQAEALKAQLSLASRSPDGQRAASILSAVRSCRVIRRYFLDPATAGGWHDHLDVEGELLSTRMPASTGYHLFGAIGELLRFVDRHGPTRQEGQ